MAYKTNLEAAKEIARQLRLRDLGGLMVIDFIDMRDRKNRRGVEKLFRDELRKDRAKTDTSAISKFGLMEFFRERLRPSIESKSYQTCQYCHGRGRVISVESAAVSILRVISGMGMLAPSKSATSLWRTKNFSSARKANSALSSG